ncbi:MAG: hypothetical protein HWN68_19710 [Desulfobacterales bacterium]|nr:hypothetical protein [Desulfobacterales bacterium]
MKEKHSWFCKNCGMVVGSKDGIVLIKEDCSKEGIENHDWIPTWSDRQARCCLYWQGKVRKRLREECDRLASDDDLILYSPEAMGVHVFRTCELVGLHLEKNPQDFVWKVAILGKRKETS